MSNKLKIISIVSCLAILTIIQTIPVFLLKPIGARELKGTSVILYYQPQDEKGAKEIYSILDLSALDIRKKLNFSDSKPTEVYVYAKQSSLFIRKYGFITLLIAPEWYIGDNRGDKVLMVSPYANVRGNDHDSIISAAIHELVHTINHQINPKLSYWIDNGVATYLAHQTPYEKFTFDQPIPEFNDLKSEDEVRFGEIGGYQYSYSYIEFIDEKYGWNSVLDLINGKKSYNEIFSKSDEDIYNEWVEFLKVKAK